MVIPFFLPSMIEGCGPAHGKRSGCNWFGGCVHVQGEIGVSLIELEAAGIGTELP